MMKHIIYITFSFIALTISCKNQQPDDSRATTQESKKTHPADLGGLYQYYHSTPKTLDQREENTIIEYLADKNLDAERTKSGVYIHTIEKGDGDPVKWGDPISVDYRGKFLNGKEFDSSYSRNAPIKFRVGTMNAGWNEALPYLHRGTKAILYLPSHMGYGKKGFPGYVGSDEILIFEVDILKNQ